MGDERLAAVADTGPLIHLAEVNYLMLLEIFRVLHVPEAVWREAKRPPDLRAALADALLDARSAGPPHRRPCGARRRQGARAHSCGIAGHHREGLPNGPYHHRRSRPSGVSRLVVPGRRQHPSRDRSGHCSWKT